MSDIRIGGCQICGNYGADCKCSEPRKLFMPRRYRSRVTHEERAWWRERYGSEDGLPGDDYWYGCYFPRRDLSVGEMGGRGTGEPQGVEWLDD